MSLLHENDCNIMYRDTISMQYGTLPWSHARVSTTSVDDTRILAERRHKLHLSGSHRTIKDFVIATITQDTPLLWELLKKQELRTMWNDEDNNPYGTSFERSDSNLSSAASAANPTNPSSCTSSLLTRFRWTRDDGLNRAWWSWRSWPRLGILSWSC